MYKALFGLPFDKISVIPNGINLNNFTGIDRDYDFRRRFAMDNEKNNTFMLEDLFMKREYNI